MRLRFHRVQRTIGIIALSCASTFACSRSEGTTKARDRAATARAPAEAAPATTAASAKTANARPRVPVRGRGIEAITGSELIGRIRRSGFKGTLVNAWASWCGPCKHEVPMLDALSANFAELGIDVVLVTMDEPGDAENAQAFLTERQLGLGSFIAARPLDIFKLELNPRWPGMIPAMFLYDAEGKLRYFWGGPAYEDEIVPIIDGFVAGKHIDGEANFTLSPGQVQR
jgi:thiol-disulfide isomerase/thioredoxin